MFLLPCWFAGVEQRSCVHFSVLHDRISGLTSDVECWVIDDWLLLTIKHQWLLTDSAFVSLCAHDHWLDSSVLVYFSWKHTTKMLQGAICDDDVRNPEFCWCYHVDIRWYVCCLFVGPAQMIAKAVGNLSLVVVAYTWLRLTASTVDLQHYLWLEIAISTLHVLAISSRTRVGFVWK